MIHPAMDWVDVSPEMISLIGAGCVGDAPWPPKPVAFVFEFGGTSEPATFKLLERPTKSALDRDGEYVRLILIVSESACRRIMGRSIDAVDGETYHLPSNLRAIGLAIRDCTLPDACRTPYRLAKSIELLCDTLRLTETDGLVRVAGSGHMTSADGKRLIAARRMIEEQWSEKLTLDMIARACGLNRAKLTRGFRDMFACSVADAIAAQRLGEAGKMLVATDLPVSSIGYRCGYLNNASFTRAFARRFGRAPTHYRAQRLAA